MPGQRLSGENMPFAIPDHVWDVLAQHKAQFPYTPRRRQDGIEPHPWRALAGFWSRRITGEHRLVYEVAGKGETQTVTIVQCRYHY